MNRYVCDHQLEIKRVMYGTEVAAWDQIKWHVDAIYNWE